MFLSERKFSETKISTKYTTKAHGQAAIIGIQSLVGSCMFFCFDVWIYN